MGKSKEPQFGHLAESMPRTNNGLEIKHKPIQIEIDIELGKIHPDLLRQYMISGRDVILNDKTEQTNNTENEDDEEERVSVQAVRPPTHDEIRNGCAKLRNSWSEAERRKRAGLRPTDEVEMKTVSPGVFEGRQ